jgi:hypothetical protein
MTTLSIPTLKSRGLGWTFPIIKLAAQLQFLVSSEFSRGSGQFALGGRFAHVSSTVSFENSGAKPRNHKDEKRSSEDDIEPKNENPQAEQD